MADTMTITFPGGARVSAEYEGFTVETDQPVDQGGENSAPAPFDLFLISLGTCAGHYARKFLAQRKLSTDDLRVELTTTKDPDRKLLSEIAIKLVLPKDFPVKYEKAIVKAVDSCTVKKTVLNPPAFAVTIEAGA
jgi:putative redox protein